MHPQKKIFKIKDKLYCEKNHKYINKEFLDYMLKFNKIWSKALELSLKQNAMRKFYICIYRKRYLRKVL